MRVCFSVPAFPAADQQPHEERFSGPARFRRGFTQPFHQPVFLSHFEAAAVTRPRRDAPAAPRQIWSPSRRASGSGGGAACTSSGGGTWRRR